MGLERIDPVSVNGKGNKNDRPGAPARLHVGDGRDYAATRLAETDVIGKETGSLMNQEGDPAYLLLIEHERLAVPERAHPIDEEGQVKVIGVHARVEPTVPLMRDALPVLLGKAFPEETVEKPLGGKTALVLLLPPLDLGDITVKAGILPDRNLPDEIVYVSPCDTRRNFLLAHAGDGPVVNGARTVPVPARKGVLPRTVPGRPMKESILEGHPLPVRHEPFGIALLARIGKPADIDAHINIRRKRGDRGNLNLAYRPGLRKDRLEKSQVPPVILIPDPFPGMGLLKLVHLLVNVARGIPDSVLIIRLPALSPHEDILPGRPEVSLRLLPLLA